MSSEEDSKLFVRSKPGLFSVHAMPFRTTSLHHLNPGCLTDFFGMATKKISETNQKNIWDFGISQDHFAFFSTAAGFLHDQ